MCSAIRGSFASALHGVMQATMDADLVADLHPGQAEPFAQLARRQLLLLSKDPERRAYVSSAEDIVLSKLEWYRLGGEVSDLQWRDVLGVLIVQGDRLDRGYMQRMATSPGVADLLLRAFEEAG